MLVRITLLFALSLIAACSPALVTSNGNLQVDDRTLAATLASLEHRSPTFAASLQVLRDASIPVHITTAHRFSPTVRERAASMSPGFRAATIHAHRDGEVTSIAVVLDLHAIQHMYRLGFRDFRRTLEDILIHEVHGHAAPLALRARVEDACLDPEPDQPLRESCVGRRENVVRAELGRRPRSTYVLDVDIAPR